MKRGKLKKASFAASLALAITLLCSACTAGSTANLTDNQQPHAPFSDTSESQQIGEQILAGLGQEVAAMLEAEHTAFSTNEPYKTEQKLLRIEFIAGDEREFVLCATYYTVIYTNSGTERSTSKRYYRYQKKNGSYTMIMERYNLLDGIMDGLDQLSNPSIKEYEALTEEERWGFDVEGGSVRVWDWLANTGTHVPFTGDSQNACYDYGYLGGRLVAVKAAGGQQPIQFAVSADGKGFQITSLPGSDANTCDGVFVNFADNATGVLAANTDRQMGYYDHRLYMTTDGGVSWTTMNPPPVSRAIGSIAVAANGTVFLAYTQSGGNESPLFYSSADSGANWAEHTLPREQADWNGIYSTVLRLSFEGNNGTLYLSGGEGIKAKYHSADGGASWQFEKETTYFD